MELSYEKRKAYFKRYYKNHKNLQDFQRKDSLLVRLYEMREKGYDVVNTFPIYLRKRLWRFNYYPLSGSWRIPESYLIDNFSMCDYMAQISGEGKFLIMSGFAHKSSRRCTWRAILQYSCRKYDDGRFKVTVEKIFTSRIQHYWFKQPKFRVETYGKG